MHFFSRFLKDHEQILAMISGLESERGVSKKLEKLSLLKNVLESHFRMEEGVYERYRLQTGDWVPVIDSVLIEHKEIFSSCGMLEAELSKGRDMDLSGIILLLKRHKNKEERLLYPKLEVVRNI